MRIALGVEYVGTRYMGWQRQHHGPSVQAELERALGRIANTPIEVICAGRTDTGVHATGQVVHFDTMAERTPYNWLAGTNSGLPDDIAVRWVREVAADFHARFDAVSRRYVYVIRNDPCHSALSHGRSYRVGEALDADAMHMAAREFLGERDFTSFRAAGCQSRSPIRHVTAAAVRRAGHWVVFDVTANAFVQHMVRNITGALVAVGRGDLPATAIGPILAARDRTKAPFAAPAAGLYLATVSYPDAAGLPAAAALPEVLPAGALPPRAG